MLVWKKTKKAIEYKWYIRNAKAMAKGDRKKKENQQQGNLNFWRNRRKIRVPFSCTYTFTEVQEEEWGLEPKKPVPKSNSTREHQKDTQYWLFRFVSVLLYNNEREVQRYNPSKPETTTQKSECEQTSTPNFGLKEQVCE